MSNESGIVWGFEKRGRRLAADERWEDVFSDAIELYEC